MSADQVLGIVGDTIGILSFFASLFVSQSENPNVATVRVSAALNGANGGSPTGADGTVAQIRLYNEDQQIIGNGPGGYVGSGGFLDISIGQINTQQATYVQVAASDDAICIPYMTETFVDGSQYGWVGDFGFECGLDWYYGNLVVDNSQTKPRCTWIDEDHTNGIKAALLFIHFPSFAGNAAHSGTPSDYCGFPAFRAYTDASGTGGIFKRDKGVKVKRTLDPRLVISSEPTHNATFLCESETSRGPDFVSLFEGVYCDMETSETLPLCTTDVTTGCFKLTANTKVKRDGNVTQKSYSDIIRWD